jgi:hypothetical protein
MFQGPQLKLLFVLHLPCFNMTIAAVNTAQTLKEF